MQRNSNYNYYQIFNKLYYFAYKYPYVPWRVIKSFIVTDYAVPIYIMNIVHEYYS